VFLDIQAGGTNTSVPTTTLFAVVAFMCVASFAAGYWWSAPLADRLAAVDTRVEKSAKAFRVAAQRLEELDGQTLALETKLNGLVRGTAELEEEQHLLTDEEVAMWRWENWPLAGVGPEGQPAPRASIDRPLPSLAIPNPALRIDGGATNGASPSLPTTAAAYSANVSDGAAAADASDPPARE
jgi:hypothetical protein